MMSRKQSIEKRIEELLQLLDEWEAYRLTARDPNEARRSEQEINRIRGYLAQYEGELTGKGGHVQEDANNPILGPAIRRNNKKWIVGIILSLLILVGGYSAYSHITREEPDYNKYLAYLQEGDKLIQENKFAEARTAYERALVYNPKDSAAIKKITLLGQATKYIKADDFERAKQVFQVIVNIPASSSLAIETGTSSSEHAPVDGQMQIRFEWSGDKLVISILGGLPFDNPQKPYILEGINCTDCISWQKQQNGYLAEVRGKDFSNITINVRDRAGNRQSGNVPAKAAVEADPATSVTTDPKMREEQFNALIESADKYFKEGKYTEAQKDYSSALSLKRGDAHASKRLEECEKKLNEQELSQAKKLDFKTIGGGTFTMGFEDGLPEERPEHEVTLGTFQITQYEVSVEQYRSFCKFTNRQMPPPPPYGWVDSYPMTNVTWEEANAYCAWVGGRLPTEAEWEYAARDGGGKSTYSGGNQLNSLAVYAENSGNRPAKTASKRANGFQLYDMSGNVSEWCADWFGKYTKDAKTNPNGASNGKYKVVRGGAYNSTPNSTQDGDQLRVTYRNSKSPSTREPYLGFRVAR